MLSRRSLLGGLLACIPLCGMKRYLYGNHKENSYIQVISFPKRTVLSNNTKYVHDVVFLGLYYFILDKVSFNEDGTSNLYIRLANYHKYEFKNVKQNYTIDTVSIEERDRHNLKVFQNVK